MPLIAAQGLRRVSGIPGFVKRGERHCTLHIGHAPVPSLVKPVSPATKPAAVPATCVPWPFSTSACPLDCCVNLYETWFTSSEGETRQSRSAVFKLKSSRRLH